MNSVGTRLFAAFLAIILLVILIVSFTLIILLRNNPLVERQDLILLANISGVITRESLLAPGQDTAQAQASAQQVAQAYGIRVLITNGAGDVLVDSGSGDGTPLNLRHFSSARRDAAFPQARVGQVRDSRLRVWLFVARPFGADRMLVTATQPKPFAAIAFFSTYLLLPLAEAAGIAALVAMVLAILISRSIALPLQKMSVVAQGIAQGDYAKEAPVSGPDEVRALGRALNSMKQQVQATQQGQRDFLANVSHELKTPLTSIQGFAQAMLDGAVATPDGIQRSAGIIYSESDRMRRLVDGLLDLARLDAGLRALARSSLDLGAILTGAADKFSLRAKEKNINLLMELPASLPAVTGDADRLAQVFTNLLDNALKHTPAGGRVTLAAKADIGAVEVSVADTGPGIPAEDLSRLFERFYQVDKSRARQAGVGLGLTISKEIVEAHGGSLRAESVVGLGSRFVVRLPSVRPDDTTLAKKR